MEQQWQKKENLEPHLRVDHLSKLLIVQGVPRLVHRTCTNWAPPWAHAFISKQFLSMVTLSVTAWTLLVHICKQVSFQVGHSNLHYCEPWSQLCHQIYQQPASCLWGSPWGNRDSCEVSVWSSFTSIRWLISNNLPLSTSLGNGWKSPLWDIAWNRELYGDLFTHSFSLKSHLVAIMWSFALLSSLPTSLSKTTGIQ